jgi:hypothetical protein
MRRKEQSSDCSGDAKRMSHVTSSEIAALRRAKYIRRSADAPAKRFDPVIRTTVGYHVGASFIRDHTAL